MFDTLLTGILVVLVVILLLIITIRQAEYENDIARLNFNLNSFERDILEKINTIYKRIKIIETEDEPRSADDKQKLSDDDNESTWICVEETEYGYLYKCKKCGFPFKIKASSLYSIKDFNYCPCCGCRNKWEM